MLPSCYELIDQLPTMPSGKVDRRRLPEPTNPQRAGAKDHVEARTDLERTIAVVFARALHAGSVSVTAAFFYDRGGHSLFAAIAASELPPLPPLADVSGSAIYRF